MIYPIIPYGDPVLRKVASPIELGSIDLIKLSEDMFETMYAASGVGLAAPQIGMDIRLFVVDGRPMNEGEKDEDVDESLIGFKKVFVNPTILEESGDEWGFEEGCLSIPGIRGEVYRPEYVKIHYWTEQGEERTDVFESLAARIIQHEYDHIEGVLFTDYLKPLRKRLIKGKLGSIERGDISIDYPMKFPKRR